MSYNLASSADIVRKAGMYANATLIASTSLIAPFCDQAEGQFIARTRWDWIGGYASINSHVKEAIKDAVSDLAAIKVISYDMTGATKAEFQVRLDVLSDNSNKIIADLSKSDGNTIRTL